MGFWGNQYVRAAAASLIAALLAFTVAKLDIAGAETSSDRSSDAIAQRVFAPFYGADRRGQDRVSVVYLDDLDADALKSTLGWDAWPPSFSDYALILGSLTGGERKPRAVFVDFVFTGDTVRDADARGCGVGDSERTFAAHCGYWRFLDVLSAVTRHERWKEYAGCYADPLTKIACIIEAGGVPVLLARSDPAELPRWTLRQREIGGALRGAEPGGPAVFVTALVDVYDYPLRRTYTGLERAAALGVEGYDLTPAAGLYAAGCISEPSFCDEPAWKDARETARRLLYGEVVTPSRWPTAFEYPLSLWWGGRLAEGQAEATEAVTGRRPDCRTLAPVEGWFAASREVLARALREALPATSDKRAECPHSFHVSYAGLAAGNTLSEGTFNRLVDGKLLLLGAQYRASNDWVVSPVHGQTPGVYIHAMALDNLFEAGRGYRRGGEGGGNTGDIVETVLVFFLAFIGFSGAIHRNWIVQRYSLPDGGVPIGRVLRLYLAIGLISLTALVTASVVALTRPQAAPINWLGVGGVAFTYALFAMRASLRDDLGGWLGRHAATAWIPRGLSGLAAWLDVGRAPPVAKRRRAARRAQPAKSRRPTKKSVTVTAQEAPK